MLAAMAIVVMGRALSRVSPRMMIARIGALLAEMADVAINSAANIVQGGELIARGRHAGGAPF